MGIHGKKRKRAENVTAGGAEGPASLVATWGPADSGGSEDSGGSDDSSSEYDPGSEYERGSPSGAPGAPGAHEEGSDDDDDDDNDEGDTESEREEDASARNKELEKEVQKWRGEVEWAKQRIAQVWNNAALLEQTLPTLVELIIQQRAAETNQVPPPPPPPEGERVRDPNYTVTLPLVTSFLQELLEVGESDQQKRLVVLCQMDGLSQSISPTVNGQRRPLEQVVWEIVHQVNKDKGSAEEILRWILRDGQNATQGRWCKCHALAGAKPCRDANCIKFPKFSLDEIKHAAVQCRKTHQKCSSNPSLRTMDNVRDWMLLNSVNGIIHPLACGTAITVEL